MVLVETVNGIVHRVTYQNAENGYAILKVIPSRDSAANLFDVQPDADQTITVTGGLMVIKKGDEVDFKGEWKDHAKYGTFLDVKQFHIHPPKDSDGLVRFLATDHFKGVGEKTAKRMIEMFGDELSGVIEESPSDLTKIKGITRKKAQEIHESWIRAQSIRNEMVSLQGLGLTPNTAQKVIAQYPGEAVKQIRENPYQLAQDIWGVGFVKADEIAQAIGFTLSHPFRIQAGLYYSLIQAIDNGHMFLPYFELLETAQKLLGLNKPEVRDQLAQMIKDKTLITTPIGTQDAVYLRQYFEVEKELAERLMGLHVNRLTGSDKKTKDRSPRSARDEDVRTEASLRESSKVTTKQFKQINVEKELKKLEKDRGFSLAPEQKSAVKMIFDNNVSVLTGGPGTGKSTTIDTIVKIAQKHDLSVALTAPTGRAAKRMEELAGYPAYTIHRLLRLQPGEYAAYNEENPLLYDVVIVDEVSMLDTFLALHLVRALKPGVRLLLVGDADQLPSVSAGNVLHDVISSQRFPVTELQTIFRQAENSAIIQNAHRIKNGVFPELPPHPTDFYFFPSDDVGDTADQIVSLVADRIKKQFGVDPITDVQVMAPLYKTKAGVTELNKRIQDELNPKSHKKNEVKFGFSLFREGDRVMQLRNNYDKDVYNGDVGSVVGVEGGETIKLSVQYPEKPHPTEYKNDEIRELTLAYAVSIHKSQGSEYPVVVMPITTSHYIMLQRNLLYTAVTRAKQLVILVGSKKAIYIALQNDKPQKRYSGLTQQISAVTAVKE